MAGAGGAAANAPAGVGGGPDPTSTLQAAAAVGLLNPAADGNAGGPYDESLPVMDSGESAAKAFVTWNKQSYEISKTL